MRTEFTDEVRAFLESMAVPGVLSTLGAKGGPVTSAVWFGLFGGEATSSSLRRRTGRRPATLAPALAFRSSWIRVMPHQGVAIEGDAEVIDDAEKLYMQSIARRYLGPDLPDWMREHIVHSGRVVFRIHPRRVRPWNIAPPP